MTEDEMAGWHHRLNGHEFDQTLRDGKGQGSLVCCSPWGCKEWDATEQQTHLYPVFLLKKEEPGQETGENNSGQPCLSEVTAGQSSGVVVVTHLRCRNQYLEHRTQARKQDLSNLWKVTALNPSVGYLYLKCLSQSFVVYPHKIV